VTEPLLVQQLESPSGTGRDEPRYQISLSARTRSKRGCKPTHAFSLADMGALTAYGVLPMALDPLPPTRHEIREAFGVDVGELRRSGEGWESVGWTDGAWFVKVWRSEPPEHLGVLAELALPVGVPCARQTIHGGPSAMTAHGEPYGLFPFFAGRHATADDWQETAHALRLVHDHPLVRAPAVAITEPCVAVLRDLLDHPWIIERRAEVEHYMDRLESTAALAKATPLPPVVLHTDFGGLNLLVDDSGRATAILDWDGVCVGPCEHDLWIAFEYADPCAFLDAYGASHVDLAHLEFALLRRAVQDLTARLVEGADREGVETWGFDRWRRLDADLRSITSYSRS
jgi:Phosphotransferase enzyme family